MSMILRSSFENRAKILPFSGAIFPDHYMVKLSKGKLMRYIENE